MYYKDKNKHMTSLPEMSYDWKGSALLNESSLHQLSPYLGKMKSSMAKSLISAFSKQDDYIYDPFSGSGTVSLEAWINNRNIISNDLNPYAYLLTKAKLSPYLSIDNALEDIRRFDKKIYNHTKTIDLRQVPKWVRAFFHPNTLREILSWVEVLRANRSYFLLACLLGILHHQRPGFLSYPSSHTVPYRRENKFPSEEFPELYCYRPVKERLEKKVIRALKRVPALNNSIFRKCHKTDAVRFNPNQKIQINIFRHILFQISLTIADIPAEMCASYGDFLDQRCIYRYCLIVIFHTKKHHIHPASEICYGKISCHLCIKTNFF